jgi:hypothetical protein
MNLTLPLDDTTAKRVRVISHAAFGSAHRLEVAAAIAEAKGKPVYGAQISQRIRANANQVGEVLRHFERAGLLERLPTPGGRRPQLFKPAKSPFWSLCRTFLSHLVKP